MNIPSRVARYHVIGRIAYGGMAEILLAKVLGPGGFERPVVIKRVLPHMVTEREFRDMFLDEARIVAAINHPNVVHVHELGREDDELYLVMEYLAGESARSLIVRAAARGVRLNLGLSAHIVAEACAGLHAAHEFTGPDGKPLEVVHRDVCPNNLIVTYEGSVKVVDFGIALAAGRFTMTNAGQVKGKAGYMAPEQCLGRPIDRRTDVFALGVVLYELTTGHRLFSDALESRIVSCLRGEEVEPPSRVVKGYPKDLERICMRALRFSASERFATAEEMRRELVRFQRNEAQEQLPEEQLKRCMHALFEDRMAEKADMLRQLRAGSGVSYIPSAEISDEVSVPVVQTERFGSNLEPGAPDATHAPPRRSRRARRRLMLLGAAAVMSIGVALVALSSVAGSAHGVRHAAQALMNAPSTPPKALPTVLATEAPAARRPLLVTAELNSQPDGADVWIDDVFRGVTPMSLELPRSEIPVTLRLVLAGHETLEQELLPNVDQRLSLSLTPQATLVVIKPPPLEEPPEPPVASQKQPRVVQPSERAAAGQKQPRAVEEPSERPDATEEEPSRKKPTSKTKRTTKPAAPGGGDEFFLFD